MRDSCILAAAIVSLTLGGGAACTVGLSMLLLSQQLSQAFTDDAEVLQVTPLLAHNGKEACFLENSLHANREALTVANAVQQVSACLYTHQDVLHTQDVLHDT